MGNAFVGKKWIGPMFGTNPHGWGEERGPGGHIGYGEYVHGKKVGMWEFKKNGMIVMIEEYDQSGTLSKIVSQDKDGIMKQTYPVLSSPTSN
jgi:hypothetical protein